MDWHDNLIRDAAGIREVLKNSRRIAVLGIKTPQHAEQAAWYVPEYMAGVGYDIVPVPVYYPEVKELMGKPVYRKLVDIPGPIDMVNVFRRPNDIDGHVDDIIAKQPKYVWFQSGIRNDRAAERLAREGIRVVQDRCLMIEHRHAAL
jgi:predicted CoA-binding protein